MKTKTILSTIFLFLFLVSSISAYTEDDIPTSISLKCGEIYSRSFDFGESINLTRGIEATDVLGYKLSPSASNHFLEVVIYPLTPYTCYAGKRKVSFTANNEDYEIWVNVTEDLWVLEVMTLKEREVLNVGGIVDFKLISVSETNVMYSVSGCEDDKEDFLEVGNFVDFTCSGEVIRFWLEDSFADLDAVKIKIFSSEPGYSITKTTASGGDYGECVLGLDTMGALVKRGNIFAIKTINILNNKRVDGVLVVILDQQGELPLIEGTSSPTGFFSKKLHEDYSQDLIVELDKEGCEPSTQIIQFAKSYNDYVDEKLSEENKKTLTILQIKEQYNFGETIYLTVTNLLNETIEGVTAKITNTDGTSNEVKTNALGQFFFDSTSNGIVKIQLSKYDYITSPLFEINVMSAEYTIKMMVDGSEKFTFKNGDKIIFEMVDSNNTIIRLTFDSEYDGETISFIDGISDEVEFTGGKAKLLIPTIGGFDSQTFNINQSKAKLGWLWWTIGVVVLIIVVIFIFNKVGKGKGSSLPTKPNMMEIQLPPGE